MITLATFYLDAKTSVTGKPQWDAFDAARFTLYPGQLVRQSGKKTSLKIGVKPLDK